MRREATFGLTLQILCRIAKLSLSEIKSARTDGSTQNWFRENAPNGLTARGTGVSLFRERWVRAPL